VAPSLAAPSVNFDAEKLAIEKRLAWVEAQDWKIKSERLARDLEAAAVENKFLREQLTKCESDLKSSRLEAISSQQLVLESK
jgi:hypothetical protein